MKVSLYYLEIFLNLDPYKLLMPKTFQMRKGETGSFQYRITEYDEDSESLVPVDLTNKSITYDLFKSVQQLDGSFKDIQFATGLDCSKLDAEEGWVDAPMPDIIKSSAGMFKITFDVEDTSSGAKRTYPRFDNQWIRVIDVSPGPTTLAGVINELTEIQPTAGDMVFWNGAGWIVVRAGLPNQVLITDPVTGFPKWEEIDVAINSDHDVISGGSA